MEGEERAVERLVALNVLPTLARALQNPEERQFYEKSFSLLLKSESYFVSLQRMRFF